MIVAVVKNYGGTDRYMKFLGLHTSTGITFVVPDGGTKIPEEEFWKVFRFVFEQGNYPDTHEILELSARWDRSTLPIERFEEKFDIQRMLDSLNSAQTRFHVVFH